MKTNYWILLLLIFTFSCSSDDEIVPPSDDNPSIAGRDALVVAINENLSPISSSNPTENFAELEALDHLAGTRIIGMGEASHGTKEFFEMKHKVLRYFVENHNYKGLIMEADFGECLRANEYVLNDIGHIDSVMQDMHFWVWTTEEVKSMIQWMHDYNLGKPLEDRIYYLGSDCQFNDDNIGLLEEKISTFPDELKNSIYQYSEKLEKQFSVMRDFDLPTMDSMLLYTDSLIWEIESSQSEIESLTSASEFQVIHRLAIVTHQTFEVTKGTLFGDNFNYRDKYMADNTLWLADHFGVNDNFMVWAHNYHVSRIEVDPEYGGPQGGQLEVLLGENYKAIGFSMATGSVNAVYPQQQGGGLRPGPIPNTPDFGSINELFYLADADNFIWVFDDATLNNSLFSWFDNWREWMQIGALHPNPGSYYTRIRLFREFDTVIHFNESSPTELIQQ